MRIRLPPRLKRLIIELIVEEGKRGGGGIIEKRIIKREGHTTYISDESIETPKIIAPRPLFSSHNNIISLPPMVVNVFGFQAPYKVEEYDFGTGEWKDVTNDYNWAYLTDLRGTEVAISTTGGTDRRFRVWIKTRVGWSFLGAIIFCARWIHHLTEMVVEVSNYEDFSADVVKLLDWSGDIGHHDAHTYWRLDGDSDGREYVRITFTIRRDNDGEMRLKQIIGLGTKPAALMFECHYPFIWDYKKNLIVRNLYPEADNAYDLGSSSYRWRDIHIGRDAYIGNNLQVGGTANICLMALAVGQSTVTSALWQPAEHACRNVLADLGKFGSSYFRFGEHITVDNLSHGVRLYNLTDATVLATHVSNSEAAGDYTHSISCTPPSGAKEYIIQIHSDGDHTYVFRSACIQSGSSLRNLFLVELEEVEEEYVDDYGEIRKMVIREPRGYSRIRFSYGIHAYNLDTLEAVICIADEDVERAITEMERRRISFEEITEEMLRKLQKKWKYI